MKRILLALLCLTGANLAGAAVVTIYGVAPQTTQPPTVDPSPLSMEIKATNVFSPIGTAADTAATSYEWKNIRSEMIVYLGSSAITTYGGTEPQTLTFTIVQGQSTEAFIGEMAPLTMPNFPPGAFSPGKYENCTIHTVEGGIPQADCVAEYLLPQLSFVDQGDGTSSASLIDTSTISETYKGSLVPIATITQTSAGSLTAAPPVNAFPFILSCFMISVATSVWLQRSL